ncbi:MAG TPA: hypothetical protein VIH99_11490 [Bdellovibrionota bacterium]|jgi:tetratricopeptide (TPR) repeat protein
MTSLGSSLWRKIFSDPFALRVSAFLLTAALLISCSSQEEGGEHVRVKRGISSRFEWAVQHYEAGEYAHSVDNFEQLRREGAEVPDFDLVAFYMGMSRFKLGQYEQAAKELESFLRSGHDREESQEARLSLMMCYEKLGRWQDAGSLAAETDKLTLFQYNRALLKLIWARALREQGELLGAKKVLESATPFLDKVGSEDRAIPFYADPNEDLWGRYYFTSLLIQEMECNRLSPSEFTPKKAKGAKKKPKAQRLYQAWLESVTDCLRKSVNEASEDLFSRDSSWAEPVETSITQGISVFGKKIEGYLKEEAAHLDRLRALQKSSREQLYRLLNTTEEQLKNFKNHGFNTKSLESVRKLVDRLLVALSNPS